MIATDPLGKVVLIGNALPSDWNGMTLTVYELDVDQQATYDALPADRGGAIFDGKIFTALAPRDAAIGPLAAKTLSVEDRLAALEAKLKVQ